MSSLANCRLFEQGWMDRCRCALRLMPWDEQLEFLMLIRRRIVDDFYLVVNQTLPAELIDYDPGNPLGYHLMYRLDYCGEKISVKYVWEIKNEVALQLILRLFKPISSVTPNTPFSPPF